MRRIYVLLGAAVAVAAAVAVIGVTIGAAAPRVIYMDPSASMPARVHDLLHRMTLKEKVGQMDQAVVGLLRDKTNPANGVCNGDNSSQPQPNCLKTVLTTDATGSVLSGGTDNPPGNTGTDWANLYNTIQRYNGTTGAFMGTFASGPINGVRTIVFRGGYMYVASENTNQVLQYNATTGAYYPGT